MNQIVKSLSHKMVTNTFVPLSWTLMPRYIGISSSYCRRLDSGAHPPSKLPSSRNNRWIELKPFHEKYDYTIKPLPFPKTGGRGPNGRIWNHRRAGGHKRNFRMIDWLRGHSPDSDSSQLSTVDPLIEKVDKICYDPNRSARIALVASGERKRYIIATHNMQPGMNIKSSVLLTKSPVRPVDGDSYPLGSLPLGTLVSCVEKFPGAGGRLACSAGVTAMLLRKQGDDCIVRLPSKREIVVSNQCTATVGQVSNVDHNKRVIGKAGRNRWLGIRPHSGRWHRKTGRFGRKIKPPKPAQVYSKKIECKAAKPERFVVTKIPGLI